MSVVESLLPPVMVRSAKILYVCNNIYCIGWFRVGDLAFGQVGKGPGGI